MNPDFFNTEILIGALMDMPLHVRMTGWERPRISVGKTTFHLGKDANSVNSARLYIGSLAGAIDAFFPYKLASEEIGFDAEQYYQHYADTGIKRDGYIHKIRYNAEPDTIVVIFSREKFERDGTKQLKEWRRAFLAPVSKDGTLEYSSRSKFLRFGTQINKLPTSAIEGLSDVVLYRFSGDLSRNAKDKFALIKPTALSLESSKKL